MSWAGAWTTILGHLTTAGASMNPPITKIRSGEPFQLGQRMIGLWYDGDQESETGGNTLGVTNRQERVIIRAYFTVATRDDPRADALELEVQQLNRAIQSALWGDAQLGGNCIAISIPEAEGSLWQPWGEAWLRILNITLFVDMANVEVIAQ